MPERFERTLRILALALAAVLVFQFARLLVRGNPMGRLRIPDLPALAAATNAVPDANPTVVNNKTNKPAAPPAPPGTNLASVTNKTSPPQAAHSLASQTNAAPEARPSPPKHGLMPGGPMGGGTPHVDLPPAVQSRVDKITDSEILGPVMRPQPMALIGIADEDAFIRAPDGQTGPVKVGHELGGIKLLAIGLNRVLIEQDGEKKELTIFGGLGSESLLSTTNDAPVAPPSQTNTTPASHPKETH